MYSRAESAKFWWRDPRWPPSPRHKIYVLRGSSVENFISIILKIQSAESWTFRLRFAADFKIQFWILKIALKIRFEFQDSDQ